MIYDTLRDRQIVCSEVYKYEIPSESVKAVFFAEAWRILSKKEEPDFTYRPDLEGIGYTNYWGRTARFWNSEVSNVLCVDLGEVILG